MIQSCSEELMHPEKDADDITRRMSRDIDRGAMVKGRTFVVNRFVGTESTKIKTFGLQQTKSLKAVYFEIDNTTALLYLVKMGERETKCY